MLERGFLATSAYYAMYAHEDKHIEQYLAAVEEVFGMLSDAIAQQHIHQMLKGPVAHTGFRRLT
jgi:hypothetical protein